MKRIELKVTMADDNTPVDYQKFLINHLRVSREGMTIPEMEQSLKIIGQLKQANGAVLIEDADYAFTIQRIDAIRWQVADSAIIQFVKDLKSARTVDPNDLVK